MAEKFRALMKVITSHVNKHWLYNNATTTINNATGKAQKKLNNIQNAVASKYDVIAKQVNNDITVFQNLNAMRLEPSPLPKKVVKWMQWYQQLTGLDAVELAKHQVILTQDKLFKCQEDRRNLNRQATIINDKLKEVYSELIQTKRDDPKYVQLTIIENKSLQDQARIVSELSLLEKEEKEHFTMLATAIKEYHDSQTMNAQKYKYLSILASTGIALISLIGSMIYNNRRIASIRDVTSQAQQKNENLIKSVFNILQNNVDTKFSEVVSILNNNNSDSKNNTSSIQHELKENSSLGLNHVCLILGVGLAGVFILKGLMG